MCIKLETKDRDRDDLFFFFTLMSYRPVVMTVVKNTTEYCVLFLIANHLNVDFMAIYVLLYFGKLIKKYQVTIIKNLHLDMTSNNCGRYSHV